MRAMLSSGHKGSFKPFCSCFLKWRLRDIRMACMNCEEKKGQCVVVVSSALTWSEQFFSLGMYTYKTFDIYL